MEYLDELVSLQNEVQTIITKDGKLGSKARTLKNDISTAITNQITGDSPVTLDSYDILRARKVCIDKNSITYSQPNPKGTYYDLTIYNDGSDDYYPYVFGKTLDHNATTGFVKKVDVDKIITAVKMNTQENLEAIPRHSLATRKLEGVPTVNSTINEGKQNFEINFDASDVTIDSERHMFEMMEVYAMQILRDTPFINWDSDATVGNLVSYLNAYSSSAISAPKIGGVITRKSLLRGFAPDETVGPYVSQFLVHPYSWGNLPVIQKYYQENNANSQLSMTNWLAVQQGVTNENIADVTSTLKYIYNPRILGSIVHRDALYQFYYGAALLGNISNIEVAGYDNSSINSSIWTDGDKPSILQCLAEVTEGALRVAWCQKFGQALKIRPEVLAQRITLAYNNGGLRSAVPKLNTIYTNAQIGQDILDLVNTQNQSNGGEALGGNNYYLNVIYNEGSPTHPSLPAGHACVAGACATVLKSMVKTHESGSKIAWVDNGRTALQPSADGDSTTAYSDGDASSMTIVGELNKLASNIALGRDFAGVHYRADGTKGMLSGEEYAISFLQHKIKEYGAHDNGMFDGFDLEKFDGTYIKITADSVTNL